MFTATIKQTEESFEICFSTNNEKIVFAQKAKVKIINNTHIGFKNVTKKDKKLIILLLKKFKRLNNELISFEQKHSG